MEINKIYHGECSQIMKTFPDNCIDLTVTSPPYDNLRNYNGYSFDFEGIARHLYRVTKKGGVIVWVVSDETINGSETGTSFKQALYFMKCGFNLHDTMIWEKPGFANPSNNRYHQVFEYMFILSKGRPRVFNPIKDRKNKWGAHKHFGVHTGRTKNGDLVRKKDKQQEGDYGQRFNIWKIKTASQENVCKKIKHPAVFSEKLANDHILSWSNKGDLVLDPMVGSGTTLKMAIENNRNYIGIDISKKYIDEIINNRLKNAQPQLF